MRINFELNKIFTRFCSKIIYHRFGRTEFRSLIKIDINDEIQKLKIIRKIRFLKIYRVQRFGTIILLTFPPAMQNESTCHEARMPAKSECPYWHDDFSST